MRDLRVTRNFDLIIDPINKTEYEVKKTKENTYEYLAQALDLCIRSMPGEWKLNQYFGASPAVMLGSPMRESIFSYIEQYVSEGLKRSKVVPLNVVMSVKAIPVDYDKIAMRIMFFESQAGNPAIVFNYMYSTEQNIIYPLDNGYGVR